MAPLIGLQSVPSMAISIAQRDRAARLWPVVLSLALGLALAFLPLGPIVAAIVLCGVVLIVFIQPLVGVALMLAAGPLGALENIALGLTFLDSGQFLFLLTACAWLARGARRRRILLPDTPLNIPLALFTAFTALTLLQSTSLVFGVKEVLKWLEIAIVMFLAIDLIYSRGRVPGDDRKVGDSLSTGLRWLVGALLLAGLSQALVGLWQFALRGDGPEHFRILGGEFYRAYGTFEQPNPFGGFMAWMTVLGLGALGGVGMVWWRKRTLTLERRHMAWWLGVGVATVATALALLFSWSRGAWLGFAAGGATMLFFWPRKRRWGVLLISGAAVAILLGWQLGLVPAPVSARLGGFAEDLRLGDVRGVDINDANYSVIERLAHWQAALNMARENLWLGVGFGNYEPAYDDYDLINWPQPLGHAHNYYLNLLAETGVIGLGLYLVVWGTIFVQTVKVGDQLPWPQRGLALGLLGVWTTLSVHHLLDKLYVNNLYLHIGVMLGILIILRVESQSKA